MSNKKEIIAGIIIIGNEVLSGRTKDINTSTLATWLNSLGVKVKEVKIIPDDEPLGPDPDPEKCICKGTGKIVQGDGHVSDCPYHSKPTSADDCEDNVKVYVPRRRGLFFRR